MLSLRWPRWLFHRRAAAAPSPAPAPKPDSNSNGSAGPAAPRTEDTFEPSGPLKVNFNKLSGFSAAEREKLRQAGVLLEKVLNSPEFKQAVLEKTTRGARGFANANGMSNEEIYATILAAKENFTSAADGELDLDLAIQNFSFWNRNVVGYTSESTPGITMNRRFFSSYTPAEIAGNLAHEWLHKLGFEHDFRSTTQRPDSVPYALGELVERLASKYAA